MSPMGLASDDAPSHTKDSEKLRKLDGFSFASGPGSAAVGNEKLSWKW